MKYSRRQWLKTTLAGTSALAFSPLDILAKETPNIRALADTNPIRLCFNENPFGVSPKAIQAMVENLQYSSQYSFNLTNELKKKIAETNLLQPENILTAAGSSLILEMVAIFASEKNGHFIYPEPSFTVFSGISEYLGMNKTIVPLDNQKKIDLPKMEKALQKNTRLIYLCNPNNPTGNLLSEESVLTFLKNIPNHVIVLLDEAYIEFAGQDSLSSYVNQFKNLIITRTFSKIYGLAGARFGYAMAHPELIKNVEKLKSWSGSEVSVVTGYAAMAALDDTGFVQKVIKNNQEAKALLVNEFRKQNIEVIPSSANFLYFSLKNYREDYFQKLKSANILGGKTYEENGKWTRISLGKISEMEKYLQSVFG